MRRLTAGILLVLALLAGACPARADKATSFTYTLNEKRRHVRTQDAYLPDKTITTLGLAKPSDLFFAADGFFVPKYILRQTGDRACRQSKILL